MKEKTYETKTDCFGFRRGECTVLYELVCASKVCSFYKTCEQYRADKRKYSYRGCGAD